MKTTRFLVYPSLKMCRSKCRVPIVEFLGLQRGKEKNLVMAYDDEEDYKIYDRCYYY